MYILTILKLCCMYDVLCIILYRIVHANPPHMPTLPALIPQSGPRHDGLPLRRVQALHHRLRHGGAREAGSEVPGGAQGRQGVDHTYV